MSSQSLYSIFVWIERGRGAISDSFWIKIGGDRDTSGNQNHSLVNLIVQMFKEGYADSCPIQNEVL